MAEVLPEVAKEVLTKGNAEAVPVEGVVMPIETISEEALSLDVIASSIFFSIFFCKHLVVLFAICNRAWSQMFLCISYIHMNVNTLYHMLSILPRARRCALFIVAGLVGREGPSCCA